MLNKRQITTGVVSVVLAITAGHLTQYGFSGTEAFQQPAPRPASSHRSRPKAAASSSVMMQSPLMPRPTITPESDLEVPDAPEAALDPSKYKGELLHPMRVPHDTGTRSVDAEQVLLEGMNSGCAVGDEILRNPSSPGSFSNCDPIGYTLVLKNGLKHLKIAQN